MKKNIGDHLRELRKGKKYTLGQLSLYSGVSTAAISKIERGDRKTPSPEVLAKLAKPLGVTTLELMHAAAYLEESDFDQITQFKKYIVEMEYPPVVRILIEKIEKGELEKRDQDILIGIIDLLHREKHTEDTLQTQSGTQKRKAVRKKNSRK